MKHAKLLSAALILSFLAVFLISARPAHPGWQKHPTQEVSFRLKAEPKSRSLPPKVWAVGEIRKNVKLGEVNLLF